MPRSKRASQFAPFDALKGLHDALKLKEYQHLRVEKGEISQEDGDKISRTILSLQKGDVAEVEFYSFQDQHYHTVQGIIKVDIAERSLFVQSKEKGKVKIEIDNIKRIDIIRSEGIN
jgi:hypothetical protein